MTHVDTGELAEQLASAKPALDSANRVSCVNSLRAAVSALGVVHRFVDEQPGVHRHGAGRGVGFWRLALETGAGRLAVPDKDPRPRAARMVRGLEVAHRVKRARFGAALTRIV